MADYLYKSIENLFEEIDKPDIPNSITDNLKHPLRDYQVEALINFIYYNEFSKKYKDLSHKHLLFHMATGSGKTQVIASSMLYLYEKGYRNFIFFVNTTSIISKTIANMIKHPDTTGKYLFAEHIKIDGKFVRINHMSDSFDKAEKNAINIVFITVQQLHIDLLTPKENRNTLESMKKAPVVLIADEAHHINAGIKKGKVDKEETNWTETVGSLLRANTKNILLEFTATAGYESSSELKSHYKDKVIYDFSFKRFNDAGYSKEVSLIHSDFGDDFRIIQALMLSEYRAILAEHEDINQVIKPVIMFKNPKGIAAVDENMEYFIQLVDQLSADDINYVFQYSKVPAIIALQRHLGDKVERFVDRIKRGFSRENCIKIYSTSKDKEETLNKLNTLENPNNPIRAIFAVNVLDEGWDVQNLYDIVKLDETKKDSKSTTRDAQLIGRGARYYPFHYAPFENDIEMRFKRKIDDNSPLKELEKMYFHSVNNSEYIEKLRISMDEQGLMAAPKYELKIKPSFIKNEFYTSGYVYTNEYEEVPNEDRVLEYYDEHWKDFITYIDNDSNAFKLLDKQKEKFQYSKTLKLKDFDKFWIRAILNQIPQFHFSRLLDFLPALTSIDEFITSDEYMGAMKITIKTTQPIADKNEIWDQDIVYLAVYERLNDLADQFEGKTKIKGKKEFLPNKINAKIPLSKTSTIQRDFVEIEAEGDWYAFEKHYGTSLEKEFVDFMQSIIGEIKNKYPDATLIRNELAFKIYDFEEGRGFAPDFILMLTKDTCTYQIFCEPKGDGFKDKDIWKQNFMNMINDLTHKTELVLAKEYSDGTAKYPIGCYTIFGTKFYTKASESVFDNSLNDVISYR